MLVIYFCSILVKWHSCHCRGRHRILYILYKFTTKNDGSISVFFYNFIPYIKSKQVWSWTYSKSQLKLFVYVKLPTLLLNSFSHYRLNLQESLNLFWISSILFTLADHCYWSKLFSNGITLTVMKEKLLNCHFIGRNDHFN